MNKFLLFLAAAAFRKWLRPAYEQHENPSLLQQLHLNPTYLRSLAKKYSILLGLGWIFSLFFVAGAAMTIYSAAQSVDDFGSFVASQVFYVSAILTVASVIAIGICLWLGLSTKISSSALYDIKETEEETPTPVMEAANSEGRVSLGRPIIQGIKEGWIRNRQAS